MRTPKRQRTKCFTGCWTCRSRRVKCDEEAPSCHRCRQAGIQCEGYGMRLSWVRYDPDATNHESDDERHGATKTPRRHSARLGLSEITRLSSPEVDLRLRQIDEWCPGVEYPEEELQQGYFSVFPVDLGKGTRLEARPTSSPLIPVASCDRLLLASAHAPTTTTAYTPSDPCDPSAIDDDPDIESHPQDLRRNPTIIVSAVSYGADGLSPHNVTSTATPNAGVTSSPGSGPEHGDTVQSEPDTIRFAEEGSRSQRPRCLPRYPPRHLDALSIPSNQKRLIHHWITFTSRKLVLLDEPHNPCRTMMLPMALKGIVSASEDSNAEIAIFHAVCASAAYNLFELGGRTSEQDQALALHHDQEAIHHLRHNLARADEHRDQSFAMAIMACIAVEAISGTTQRWRTHVSGGLAYLAKLHFRGVDELVVSAFRRHMVLMAILCDFDVPPELKAFLNDDGGGGGDDDSAGSLEFTFPYYGVSRSFLRAHDQMNAFAAAAASSSAKATAAFDRELDAFELKLYLDFPSLPLRNIASVGEVKAMAVHHMSKVFYYAALVYFQRSIRRAPVDAVQALVELGVHELESLEKLGRGELGCMMLWPVLVLGAECGGQGAIQQRMRRWFQDQRKLGFRNLVVLEDLVATVWRLRAESSDRRHLDWREIIVQEPFDVFRL